ncbi:MAG: hypothetical protein AAGE05_06955 [Pseudomonadota bacterium]
MAIGEKMPNRPAAVADLMRDNFSSPCASLPPAAAPDFTARNNNRPITQFSMRAPASAIILYAKLVRARTSDAISSASNCDNRKSISDGIGAVSARIPAPAKLC